MLLCWLLALSFVGYVNANVKAVFAHFMVSNTGTYTVGDWENDISLARAASIDGFVLNMARGEKTNGDSLQLAFDAAANLGNTFKLLFSFDYAGHGLWPKEDVIALITKHSSHPAYFRRGSQPLVSTFEGPKAAQDWPAIKAATNCFFMPSWSSLGAQPAWETGVADGLFSWAAWPTGPNDMDTFTDASYLDTLNGKPYMMGVSPWFYTNMPGFRKNWLWRGDDLWFDRWTNVLFLQPEYVQIITWNDYGESHHIGPLRDKSYVAFDKDKGNTLYNYVLGKPHDAWRLFLPYLIEMAKTNSTSFNQENVIAWFRPHPKAACGTGGTTGNTASQLQTVYAPGELVEDRVFYAALLASAGSVTVSIGGQSVAGTWNHVPSNGIGLYRGSVPFSGRTGTVVVTVTGGGRNLQASGGTITTECTQNVQNWNPFTIQGVPRPIGSVSPLSLATVGCTRGFGAPKYQKLCEFACKYDYCPKGACTCTALGTRLTRPTWADIKGCPAEGIDSTFLGLCSFGCSLGYCPNVCKIYPTSHTCVAPNPTAPPIPACVAGQADGDYEFLCAFTCLYGFCPPEICTCTRAGTRKQFEGTLQNRRGSPKGAEDYGLCEWACPRGICPTKFCNCEGPSCQITDPVPSFQVASPSQITATIKNQLGQGCYRATDCSDQDDLQQSSCPSGHVKLGWDKAGCSGKAFGKSICCSNTSLQLGSCIWRGNGFTRTNGGDCNGQCHVGETTVLTSSWGGSPTKGNNNKCGRGVKAFCCGSSDLAIAFHGCRWTGCGGSCDAATEEEVASENGCVLWRSMKACCPKPSLVTECVWRGELRDCADARCNNDEVAIRLSGVGNSNSGGCNWGRKMTNCCKISVPAPDPPPRCDYNLCQDSFMCEPEDYELSKRAHDAIPYIFDENYELDSGVADTYHSIAKRSSKTIMATEGTFLNDIQSNAFWSRQEFLNKANSRNLVLLWFGVTVMCTDIQVIKNTVSNGIAPRGLHTEHPLDVQVMMRFLEACATGEMPDGSSAAFRISAIWINAYFIRYKNLALNLPRVPGSTQSFNNPMAFVMEALGSITNLDVLVLFDGPANSIKGALMGLTVPLSEENFRKKLMKSLMEGTTRGAWLAWLSKTIAVFKYLHTKDMSRIFTKILADVGTQLALVETNTPQGGQGLAANWPVFIEIYLRKVALLAQTFVLENAVIAQREYDRLQPYDHGTVTVVLTNLVSEAQDLHFPGYPNT